MIISHKFKFIFIKTRKTAGTSIEVYLSELCGPDDIVTPIIPHAPPHSPRNYEGFYNHMPGYTIRAQVGSSVWNTYHKFCVERNPWDKVLSHFSMMRSRSNGALTFEQYMLVQHFPVNFPMYTEPSDSEAVIVDEILRYEALSEGLSRTFKRLGIPFSGDLGVYAKAGHRTDLRHYTDIYSPEQAELVRKAFSTEIKLNGYSF